MNRYRLVTDANGHRHVSSVLLGEAELEENLDAEAILHRMTGWTVTRGDDVVIARRGRSLRVVSVRRSDPMEDTL